MSKPKERRSASLLVALADADDERHRHRLESLGFSVHVAGTGPDVLRLLGSERLHFDLLAITSLELEGINGLELARKAQELSPETQVLWTFSLDDLEQAVKRLTASSFRAHDGQEARVTLARD